MVLARRRTPAAKPPRVPFCPPITVEESAKAATAIFNGTVTDVTKQPRTDGPPGAIYLQTVTVDSVYRGEISTETVQVQTDRNRADCSLGALQVDREYMFFVSGTGQPWVAGGTSGTRDPERQGARRDNRAARRGRAADRADPRDGGVHAGRHQ